MAFSVLGMLHRLFRKNDDVKLIFQEYKKIFATIGLLMAAVFVSALTSGFIEEGLKSFLHKYIGHVVIMLPVLLIFDKKRILILAKLLLTGIFFSNLIVVGQGLIHFDEVWRFGGMIKGSQIAVVLPVYAALIMCTEHKRILIFGAFVGFGALIFNGTRGVWLSSLFLVPAVIFICAKNKLKSFGVVVLILAIVGGIFASTPNLSERFSSITNLQMQSNAERLLIWESSFNMFADNPILGVGYGQYKNAYQNKYISAEAKEHHLDHAHNNIIQMLAECGIVGASAFMFMWLYFSYFSLKEWFKNRKIEWLLFFCVLSGIMLHGLTEFNFETSTTAKILWYSLGLCTAYSRQKSFGSSNNF